MDSRIEETAETAKTLINHLLVHWREHVNRRTLTVLIAILAPFMVLYITALRAPSEFPSGSIITVEHEQSLEKIALALVEEKVIRSAPAFELIVRILRGDRKLHAGDYLFRTPRNSWRIARAIIAGDYGIEPVRINVPAGATVEGMADIFEKRMIRFNRTLFVERALPYEGYLYPDTYFFLPTAREDIIINTLRETFDAKMTSLATDVEKFGKTIEDVVIMASLLEREESDYEDKRKIAGVLWKRLEINMPLQVDATFVYIIGKGSNQLTLEDLEYDSPYNTYKNKGLPPGPIASPSIDSIRAAINPAKHDYLFYLADRNGTTHYSATYKEHLRKKRYYLGF